MVQYVSKFGIGLSFHDSMDAGDTDVASILRCYPAVSHLDRSAQIDRGNIDTQHISVFMNKFRIRHYEDLVSQAICEPGCSG